MKTIQRVGQFLGNAYNPLIQDLKRLPSVAKFGVDALKEPKSSRIARMQEVTELLGEAAKNPIKRTSVGQFIRALKSAHPERLPVGDNIEFGKLPLPLQAAIKYMAKEGSPARQQELEFSEDVVKLIIDTCEKKSVSSKETQGHISYEDYCQNYFELFSNGDIIKNAYNPTYQLGRALGRFSYKFTEDIQTKIRMLQISDTFNFNNVHKKDGGKSYFSLVSPFIPEAVLALKGQLNTPIGLESAGLTGAIMVGNPYIAARKLLPYLGEPFDINLTIPLK